MESTFPTEAIILDRYYFREYDSRIVVYSREYGKMDLVVRGTRRPKSKLAGHIEPISETALMVVRGKQYNYIGSARGLNAFSNLKGDYDLLVTSGKAIRMFKKLIELGEADSALYNLLKNYLNAINQKDVREDLYHAYYYSFVFKLIAQLGYHPELSACSKCSSQKANQEYFFNYISGGLVCKDCGRGQKNNLLISDKTISFLHDCEQSDFCAIDRLLFDERIVVELKKVLGMYVKYNLEFEI